MNNFLLINNDVWFNFEKLIEDFNGEFYWTRRPMKIQKHDICWVYLSGGTKAIKYKFVVTEVGLNYSDISTNFSNYLILDKMPKKWRDRNEKNEGLKSNQKMMKIKLIGEIKDLSLTTPKRLKEDGGILGSLMSDRSLRINSINWLESLELK